MGSGNSTETVNTFSHQVSEAVIADAIVSVSDLDGKIIFANENFCAISGYALEELLGQDHRLVNSGFHEKNLFVEMWSTIVAGRIWKGEIKNKRKDGSFYWVLSTIVPIKGVDGQVVSYVSVRHDISERKEAQAKLIQASKLSSLGEATAKIAHELNNPLTVVLGVAQVLLKNANGSTEFNEKINKIVKAAERMSRLILQMKKHSRNSSEDPRQALSLAQVIESSLILTEAALETHRVEWSTDFQGGTGRIFGDSVQLESIIQNFISNSIDAFCNPHTGTAITNRKVKMSVRENQNHIEFIYEDNAGGIPESVQRHMFDTFYTTKGVGQGTGLGLSMIKTIVQDHKAVMSVQSQLGQGTRFSIQFPKYRATNSDPQAEGV